ncbi:hypothetical protein [Bosea sp. ANAM02]|uniref:hypothetical protein n=1 Tax=Bosea sp. ANAM02 TaxID=2020412 RepID=UPI00140EB18C|nr:hypothetical protein [Bosea sp. ANAM02]BCB18650.1 hypothetical protein OCUBac02_15440 [Bosea sp. ANAM02]
MTDSPQQSDDFDPHETDWEEHYLEQFGSKAAIEAETEHEMLIDQALARWKSVTKRIDPRTKEEIRLITYHGLETYPGSFADLKPHIIDAVSAAYPIPVELRGVLQEYQDWQDLRAARYQVCGWEMSQGVGARELILEDILSNRPGKTLDDIAVRATWWHSQCTEDFDVGNETHDQLHERILADIAELSAAPHAARVSTGFLSRWLKKGS